MIRDRDCAVYAAFCHRKQVLLPMTKFLSEAEDMLLISYLMCLLCFRDLKFS